MNVAFSEFLRANRLSSKDNLLREGFAMVSDKLRRNGYAENMINQMLSRATNLSPRQQHKLVNKIAKKPSPFINEVTTRT